MDKKLQILQYLYEEVEDRSTFRTLLEEDAVGAEYQALSEAKFQLDHQRRSRPDPIVIDRIMAAAAAEGNTPITRSRWRDRPALAGRLSRRNTLRTVGLAMAAVLVVAVGLWPILPTAEQAPAPVVADVARPSTAKPAPAQEHLFTAPATGLQQAGVRSSLAEDALSWDEASDVHEVHRRVEMLQARNSSLEWDEPAVPLEMLPAQGRQLLQPGLRPARQQRPPRNP